MKRRGTSYNELVTLDSGKSQIQRQCVSYTLTWFFFFFALVYFSVVMADPCLFHFYPRDSVSCLSVFFLVRAAPCQFHLYPRDCVSPLSSLFFCHDCPLLVSFISVVYSSCQGNLLLISFISQRQCLLFQFILLWLRLPLARFIYIQCFLSEFIIL